MTTNEATTPSHRRLAISWLRSTTAPVGRPPGAIDARALAEELDLAGGGHPAPFVWRLNTIASAASFVGSVLDVLEEAAAGLYPAWLPEAEGVTGVAASSEPAVKALALRVESTTDHHGPYLAELSAVGVTGLRLRNRTVALRSVGPLRHPQSSRVGRTPALDP